MKHWVTLVILIISCLVFLGSRVKTSLPTSNISNCGPVHRHLRWDHADTSLYFNATFNRIRNLYDQVCLLQNDIASNFCEYFITNSELDVNYKQIHSGWLNSIETCYEHLVYVLIQAVKVSIPNEKTNFFKFWWDAEAEIFKQNSIVSHRD